jgi:hypothetical protein
MSQGIQGPGPTGPSVGWTLVNGNLAYVPGATNGIFINKSQTSTYLTNTTLDISGNVNITGILTTGSEINNSNLKISGTVSIGKPVTSTPTCTLDVSGNLNVTQDSSFNSNLYVNKISYLSNISERIVTTSIGADSSCNLDFSQGSVFYLGSIAPTQNMRFNIINLPSLTDLTKTYVISAIYKGNSNYYGNLISIKPIGGTTFVNFVPNFPSTPSITTGKLVTQTIGYLYFTDASYVISNVTCYQN